jgi:HAD superfamily hydrolase (TIGR01509 family)
MLKAIIFDFNGVISDDEPIHLSSMVRVLEEEGIKVPLDEYHRKYLGRDDRDCFRLAFAEVGRPVGPEMMRTLVQRKSVYYRQSIQRELRVFPGVVPFIEQAYHHHYELAVASGALRSEIEFVLNSLGLRDRFRCVASSHEIDRGKPEPDIFLKTLEDLNLAREGGTILPTHCLVIEDSLAGIKAALSAGMKCLAVTNTYPAESLAEAHHVVASLDISLESLQVLFP